MTDWHSRMSAFRGEDGTTRIVYFWNQGYPKSEPSRR